ncbi:hypothetical protein PoB_001561400 [Plakobranchus ocellatus]|uniref:Uncharacterized protein n=1 Tax=Plakobranchus ocellatus TaxID=259542 RepID=A0AAV3Z511_9GAST|nr:hypothetical protein PoB_001561400 [Plakobranchus ocellatus]
MFGTGDTLNGESMIGNEDTLNLESMFGTTDTLKRESIIGTIDTLNLESMFGTTDTLKRESMINGYHCPHNQPTRSIRFPNFLFCSCTSHSKPFPLKRRS